MTMEAWYARTLKKRTTPGRYVLPVCLALGTATALGAVLMWMSLRDRAA